MPSQTFIRREIAALEESGLPIERFSIRGSEGELPDPSDQAERDRTTVVLDQPGRLLFALAHAALRRPRLLLAGVATALRLGRKSVRGLPVHLFYLLEACLVLRWFDAAGITHVHSHFGTNATAVASICRSMGGPTYSFTVHGPEEFDRPEALKLTEKIDGATFVAAISDHGRSQIYRWCPHEQWDRVHVVRCGLDAMFLDDVPTTVPDVVRLVNVGRLEEQKGQLLLVEAVRRLVAQGRDVEVLIIGDGSMRPQLESVIADHGLEPHVTLAGWRSNDEVRTAVAESRATVLASFAEGLPVAIMESFALGRTVVTTHVAGIPELVRPGENGWLVPPGSADGLAAAISAVLDAGVDRLSEMGAAGRESVRAAHDVRIEAARLRELFVRDHGASVD